MPRFSLEAFRDPGGTVAEDETANFPGVAGHHCCLQVPPSSSSSSPPPLSFSAEELPEVGEPPPASPVSPALLRNRLPRPQAADPSPASAAAGGSVLLLAAMGACSPELRANQQHLASTPRPKRAVA